MTHIDKYITLINLMYLSMYVNMYVSKKLILYLPL